MNRTLFALCILALSIGVAVGSTFFIFNTNTSLTENTPLTSLIERMSPVTVSITGNIFEESGVTTRAGTGIIV